MAEDDNFDIDIYGDGGGYNGNEGGDFKTDEPELILDPQDHTQNGGGQDASAGQKPTAESGGGANGEQVTTTDTAHQPQHQFPPSQGVKRKEHDDRPSDPDAMSALLISDLFWWTTDDDIRGFVRDAQCEDELKDVTFSEHKVNGKSKGQAFLEFTSLQASTATKRQFESFNEAGETNRRHMVTYTTPFPNPFRTLPKDAPMRKDHQARGSGGFHSPNQNMNFGGMNNMGGGFRGGGRGGFHHRGGGGMGNNMGGFGGPNRPFPNPMGGGGFQGGPGGGPMGFQGNPMGGMQNMGNFGFNNRGNMMGGMRGGMRGRGGGGPGGGGGMPTPNMMGMPGMAGPMGGMGGMGMNPMGAGGMNPMMGGMGGNMGMQGGFQGPNPGFNQGFFPGGQGGVGDGSWNPHGAKRSRQE